MNASIQVINALVTMLTLGWALGGVAIELSKTLMRTPPELAKHLFHELRPFYLPAVVIAFVTTSLTTDSWWRWANLGISLWNWWALRNADDDDDRWKRRRRRIAERIQVSEGRLAVVTEANR